MSDEQFFFIKDGEKQVFNSSWYRGKHTNFIPTKAEFKKHNAIYEYFLKGLLPEEPFITKSMPLTAFGSCFAAHVSKYLALKSYNILGKTLSLDAHIIRFGEGIVNTFAVLQQLEWALLDKEMPENLWFSKDKEIAPVSPQIRSNTKKIMLSTEVFIFTLGLSEVWFDNQTGEALWRAVPLLLFDPKRHEFRQTTVSENVHNIKRIIEIVQQHRPQAKIIFTLSPVPLSATFRDIPCLIANSVSKSTLRCALDEALRSSGYSNVYYFPSYELVTSALKNPFKEDNRHIRKDVVQSIMHIFEQSYCCDAPKRF
ncbi:MAG: hypothetical protein CMK59_09805 [Proteobacteria bacterium]|nr:hypothetical protein [Pseudomonadota bacterium]